MAGLLEPAGLALIVFAASFAGLMGLEKLIHWLTKNPDKNYRWGVWTFSILAAAYTFATSLGR